MNVPALVHRIQLRRLARISTLALVVACAGASADPAGRMPPHTTAGLEPSALAPLTVLRVASLGGVASADTLAPGLIHWSLRLADGPWMVHVLDVDLAACWSPVALKGGSAGVGRARTTELLDDLVDAGRAGSVGSRPSVAAAVNADFFRFNPPGVPLAAHIRAGRVIAGPSQRPVIAIDGAGVPSIGVFSDTGYAVIGADTLPLESWNRVAPDGLALFDENWRSSTDSATGALEVIVSASSPRRVSRPGMPDRLARHHGVISGTVRGIDTTPAGIAARAEHVILVAGPRAPAALHARLRRADRAGDSVHISVWLRPFHPRDAVGGFPVLVRTGAIVADLDSAGGRGFGPVRHPRTAVGLSAAGRRLLLVTVDGRQPGYSAGMTLPELAGLMLALGATEALNLDGGGSTTMAILEGAGMARIANQPSDTAGERPVANALAVLPICASSLGERDRLTSSGP